MLPIEPTDLAAIWTATPIIIRWILSAAATAAASLAVYQIKRYNSLATLLEHNCTNCIPTIQTNTGRTADAVDSLAAQVGSNTDAILQTRDASLETRDAVLSLVAYMRAKVEDGKI